MPLRADVDPRARRHLAVHRQPLRLQLAKRRPVGPFRNQVRVGDQDARRARVRLEDRDRLAALHDQAFRHLLNAAASERSRRRPPTNARRDRCRRKRRDRRDVPPRLGSRLFINMRNAASCGQPKQEISLPRGARTARGPASTFMRVVLRSSSYIILKRWNDTITRVENLCGCCTR